MTNPKTVKEVLEELANCDWEYIIVTDPEGQELISQAQLQLDALYKARYLGMLPEEKEYQKGHNAFNESVEFTAGFNSAIQEMRGKITPRKEN